MEYQFSLTTFLLLMSVPLLVWAGECCKAHYDILLSYNEEKWCDDFCCVQLGKYDCCSNVLLQAPSNQRNSICAAYFSQHKWVPTLIGLGCLVVIVVVIVCICKACCCQRRANGGVIRGAAPGLTVVNLNSGLTTPQQPSYPIQQPGYPMQHQPNGLMQSTPSYPA
ncbi:uncharacterized protein LOC134238346 [Saccostrea cucullata]|uniref:uncharacterized protein LOC134238346 n=1 Tax=Saccostrea cuccullata TaxID=36930 RepID=UPI002ED13F90